MARRGSLTTKPAPSLKVYWAFDPEKEGNMDNEELTQKYYELASQVTTLATAVNELKKASHKGEALSDEQLAESTTKILKKMGVIN